jgi:DNA-binding transcriptional regulator LsrR (DeoR family)
VAMGKQEVIDYLIKKKSPATQKEMAEKLRIGRANISTSCRSLKKENAIIITPSRRGCFTEYMISLNPIYMRRKF